MTGRPEARLGRWRRVGRKIVAPSVTRRPGFRLEARPSIVRCQSVAGAGKGVPLPASIEAGDSA